MTEIEFQTQLDRLGAEFKGLNYSPSKASMIFGMCAHLPQAALARVVTHFIASFRHAPLVKDFAEALRGEAERAVERDPVTPYQVECDRCGDLGIVEVECRAWQLLAKCWCPYGTRQTYNLPRVAEIADPKNFRQLDAGLFKPTVSPDDRSATRSLIEKTRWWRERIRISEQMWSNHPN